MHHARAASPAEITVQHAAAVGGARVAAEWQVAGEAEAREEGGDAEGGGGLLAAFAAVADVDGERGGEG
ncbi:hypothetical protein MMC11_005329, partial [Xylographa trunciseda]|nr:hypothetical protein [Xylographa trunciseda]